MEVINVGLYGGKSIFGGRENPLEASVIYCDKHENCSYYKNKQCINVRAPFSNRCKYGKVENICGYTSRAKKYREFKDKFQEHEKYGKLDNPPKKLGLIGSEIVFPYPHITIDEDFRISGPKFISDGIAFIPLEIFNLEFIEKICRHRPYAMMGGIIEDYQKKIVPMFLTHLKELLPEIYIEFVENNPDFCKEINYVGRVAQIKTINPSVIKYAPGRYASLSNGWFWDGEVLTYQSGYISSLKIINRYEIVNFQIKPLENATIKITSNEQVNENTIFVD